MATHDDEAMPSLDFRARDAALYAATYAEAWTNTLGEIAEDKRRHRAMRRAGNAASYARMAAKAIDKAMAAASAE